MSRVLFRRSGLGGLHSKSSHRVHHHDNIVINGLHRDRAFYIPNQQSAINLTYETPNDDQPIKVTYGPDFFSSYHAIPGLEFTHGLNLAYNGSD